MLSDLVQDVRAPFRIASSVPQTTELPDDATRPAAPRIEGVSPQQRARGRRLRLYHGLHLRELAQVRQGMELLIAAQESADVVAGKIASLSMASNYRAFGNLCGQQCEMLTMHHTIEDQGVFPQLRAGSTGWRKVVDRLMAEHGVIHDLLIEFNESVAAVGSEPTPAAISAMRDAYERLERFVMSHFGYEERELEEALGYYGVPL